MKVVIIPGVGYQSSNETYSKFGNNIKKKMDCSFEIFKWNYDSEHDIDIKKIITSNLSYYEIRRFVVQVILDFEFSIRYGGKVKIPEADYYIGHSAGSLFALSQSKPCSTMGSPEALVKCFPDTENPRSLFLQNIRENTSSILNFVNRYDVLSYPVENENKNVKNIYFHGWRLNPSTYSPISALTSYWTSGFVVDEIVKHMKVVFNK